MLKIFLSSTYRDLAEYRSKILEKLNAAFKGVGMEQFIPDGSNSQEVCIGNLIKNDVVIFLISSYYGSLMKSCSIKEDCKAVCPMKTGSPIPPENRISYTHCEYKTTVAEGILHQTYLIEKGWDNIPADIRKQALEFKKEIGEEYLGFIDIKDPNLIQLICSNLATKMIEWHTQDKLDFDNFCDREEVLNELLENIDSKVEVWGVGGIGKTALIELALLIQKLKGKRILTIGTSRAYASGSGFEDFRTKCEDEQYIAGSHNEITIYDVINAFAENGLLPNAEDISKLPKDEKIEILVKKIRSEKNLTLFIDDFHLATEDVSDMAKSVDHLILSSRKNTYIARKEIYLSGINEEDRENLVKLFSVEIPENVIKLINRIAEGHPVSTELLVRNYENIDFDKIKDFNLEDADDTQVKDFYKRVIEEIFSTNKQALFLLKDLATLNTDLSTNINRESVLKSYNIEGIRKMFKNLVDTGMVKKRQGSEGLYEFYFKHIKDYLEDEAEKSSHEKAILYYEKKKEIIDDKYNINDDVEVLYHKVKSTPNEYLVDFFREISNKIQPVHYGFKRLIDVGKELKALVKEEIRAPVLTVLGILYSNLGRFEEAENSIKEALEIYKELATNTLYWEGYNPEIPWTQNALGTLYLKFRRFEEAEHVYQEALELSKKLAAKNPNAYKSYVLTTQNNLGALYLDLGRFEEAENVLRDVLEIYKELAAKNPDEYNLYVATAQNNLGVLYWNLGRFEEAETAYTDSLDIRKELVAKNPDAYNPDEAGTQNNLGNLYRDLGRFEEAETTYQETLDIYKELATKNPDAYNPDVAGTQNNLGVLYRNLGRFEKAETIYQEALDIYEELAAKNPDAYNPDVAVTKYNLGNLYWNLGRFEEAETAYTGALDIRKELAAKNPDRYNPDVAMTQNNLGVLYQNLGRFEEAETAYTEALDIRKELAAKNPDEYKPDVAMTQNNFGTLYAELRKFDEAEAAYTEALNIRKELANKNPHEYNPKIAIVWYNKACLESKSKNKEKSVESLKKAIELDENYIDMAKSDKDFYNIRTSKEFKEIIGE